MIEDIVRASGLFMKALAGEKLDIEECEAAIRLLSLPNEQLRYTDPSTLPRHSKSLCDGLLERTPEERCGTFLDGIRYGVEKGGGSYPARSAYNIVRIYVDDLPTREKDVWLKVLEQYSGEHKL